MIFRDISLFPHSYFFISVLLKILLVRYRLLACFIRRPIRPSALARVMPDTHPAADLFGKALVAYNEMSRPPLARTKPAAISKPP